MSGARLPMRRAVARCHGHRDALRLRPTISFEQLYGDTTASAAASLPVSIDVAREFLRQLHRGERSRSAAAAVAAARGVSTYTAAQSTPSCAASRGAAHQVRYQWGIGADAAQQRILGLPDALDRLVGAIRLHVVFHPVGGCGSASSRSAIKLPSVKKFLAARSTCQQVHLPAPRRANRSLSVGRHVNRTLARRPCRRRSRGRSPKP